jgi:hypothetical protein
MTSTTPVQREASCICRCRCSTQWIRRIVLSVAIVLLAAVILMSALPVGYADNLPPVSTPSQLSAPYEQYDYLGNGVTSNVWYFVMVLAIVFAGLAVGFCCYTEVRDIYLAMATADAELIAMENALRADMAADNLSSEAKEVSVELADEH